jgi:hypothetical protein
MFKQGLITPFWGDDYQKLNYVRRPHNNSEQLEEWKSQGFTHKNFTGKMYGMDNDMPSWTKKFFELFDTDRVGLTLYVMETGDVMPTHSDTFAKFRQIHNLSDSDDIYRAIVFLEDWRNGHVFEIDSTQITGWKAGDYVLWKNDTPHMAANLGLEPRYTAQLTFVSQETLL